MWKSQEIIKKNSLSVKNTKNSSCKKFQMYTKISKTAKNWENQLSKYNQTLNSMQNGPRKVKKAKSGISKS